MPYRITVDVGGTFTDVVVAVDEGGLWVGKALTEQRRVFVGIQAALEVAAAAAGRSLGTLLGGTSLFVYASTVALNATLEGRTARTALLVTAGFPDVLVLREGGRQDAFDFTRPYPEPYVPRRLTYEIPERIDAEGGIVMPLDEDRARAVLDQLAASGVEAIGVSLLWSIVNPIHEQRLGELIRDRLPEGSEDAFTDAELRRYNARAGAVKFDPYKP